MLKSLIPVSLVLFIAVVSCKKSSDSREGVFQTGLGGSWVATEYILDIGDGDTSWKKVSNDQQEVISFDSTGKGTIFNNGIQASGYYQVSSDSTMEIIGGSISSRAHYKLFGDTLNIAGFCTEACVTRYLRPKLD